jgi:hypothetical protein
LPERHYLGLRQSSFALSYWRTFEADERRRLNDLSINGPCVELGYGGNDVVLGARLPRAVEII